MIRMVLAGLQAVNVIPHTKKIWQYRGCYEKKRLTLHRVRLSHGWSWEVIISWRVTESHGRLLIHGELF